MKEVCVEIRPEKLNGVHRPDAHLGVYLICVTGSGL